MLIDISTLPFELTDVCILYFRSTGDITTRIGKDANFFIITFNLCLAFDVTLALGEMLLIDHILSRISKLEEQL